MKLENQVCSLKLAKKLKKLGVKQESLWLYLYNKREKEWGLVPSASQLYQARRVKAGFVGTDLILAFTVAELGKLLPKDVYIPYKGNSNRKRKYPQHLHCFFSDNYGWTINYTGGNSQERLGETDKNEANARAKMLIYLLENNLTKK